MIFKKKHIIVSLIALVFSGNLAAQEIISPLSSNPAKQHDVQPAAWKSSTAVQAPLSLPFFDDFSVKRIRPDQSKWADSYVFINKDFGIAPPNTGVATFDVLDQDGFVYKHASTVPFVADMLSSLPIRLDSSFSAGAVALSPADSVYLSFFYQPQGRGDKPETNDSLILQLGYPTGNFVLDYIDSVSFPVDVYLLANGLERILPLDTVWSPSYCRDGMFMISSRLYTWGDDITVPCDSVFKAEIAWKTVWAAPGMSYQDFVQQYGVQFRQVMIPVADPIYFTNSFMFRFFNYGSIADNTNPGLRGNVDQWNIDFVYLNKNRSYTDTYYNKISFSERAPSFLKRYESMPYKQYRAAPTIAIKPELSMKITNLSSETRNTRYRYDVKQIAGTQQFTYDGGNCNLTPFTIAQFQTCETGCGVKHACPEIRTLFSLDYERDTTSFVIRHFISDSSAMPIMVDSLVYRQGFYNYFAYDDGTPELGYGLEPAGASLALQYTLMVPDTLYAIQILFNKTLNEANNKLFDLMVWRDQNGRPGQVAYRKIRQRPQFSDELYGFHLYVLDEPVVLNGNFYVGLMQEESGSYNIGFDAVNNSKQYLFINVDGTWRSSMIDGALMIRPVFGAPELISVAENKSDAHVRISPNPFSHTLNIQLLQPNFNPQQISLYDLTGRLLINMPFVQNLDASFLKPGFYFIRIEGENSQVITSKILKTN